MSDADDRVLADEVRAATALLERIQTDRGLLAVLDPSDRKRLLMAAGRVARPTPWDKRELRRAGRRLRRDRRRQADERALSKTGIRTLRRAPVFETPHLEAPSERASGHAAGDVPKRVEGARACYVCKQSFHELHAFYDAMCSVCAELNWAKRTQTADLTGRVALVTGARVKIGYQAGIKLLRAGARVIVTTRFPRDAAGRYAGEADYSDWRDRLDIYGLDLRHTPSVERFAEHVERAYPRLDFLVNNACQTVRRPAGFYAHLVEAEAGRASLHRLPAPLRQYESMRCGDGATPGALTAAATAVGLTEPATLSQLALLEDDLERSTHLFPAGALDQDLQQIDLRETNSWRMRLDQVSAVELLEVQLVNAVAPFILNARLRALMARDPTPDKHIVNVSAMEGQFYRRYKTDKHPHTNMAKAALNMMTRTSAVDYVRDGIHMNSVDTGWVTDEDPGELAARKVAVHGFHPPLDIVDGAARLCDPIVSGINTGTHLWGRFLKDYTPVDW